MIGTEQRPRWIPLQDMAIQGSIGMALIAQIPDLGIRQRPTTIFDQPVGTILQLPKDQLPQLSTGEHRRLQTYIDGLAITPHARLLGHYVHLPQTPIPPQNEEELMTQVETALRDVPGESRDIIRTRFGLDTGVPESLSDIARSRSQDKKRVIVLNNMGRVRGRPGIDITLLEQYIAVPQTSFGREIFSAVFKKNLPYIGQLLSTLDLSEDASGELAKRWRWIHTDDPFDKLFMLDLHAFPFSSAVYEELAEALRNELQEKPPVNHLLPEILLGDAALEQAASESIDSLDTVDPHYRDGLRELGIRTVGRLLRLDREQLADIVLEHSTLPYNWGTNFLIQIGTALQNRFGFDPDLDVPALLTESHKHRSAIFNEYFYESIIGSRERAERDRLKQAREAVEDAQMCGYQSLGDIYSYLSRENRIRSFAPKETSETSWVIQAMIEYLINHPEDSK